MKVCGHLESGEQLLSEKVQWLKVDWDDKKNCFGDKTQSDRMISEEELCSLIGLQFYNGVLKLNISDNKG